MSPRSLHHDSAPRLPMRSSISDLPCLTPDHNGYDQSIQDPGRILNPEGSWVVQRPANGFEKAYMELARLTSAMHPTSVLRLGESCCQGCAEKRPPQRLAHNFSWGPRAAPLGPRARSAEGVPAYLGHGEQIAFFQAWQSLGASVMYLSPQQPQ